MLQVETLLRGSGKACERLRCSTTNIAIFFFMEMWPPLIPEYQRFFKGWNREKTFFLIRIVDEWHFIVTKD